MGTILVGIGDVDRVYRGTDRGCAGAGFAGLDSGDPALEVAIDRGADDASSDNFLGGVLVRDASLRSRDSLAAARSLLPLSIAQRNVNCTSNRDWRGGHRAQNGNWRAAEGSPVHAKEK